MRELHLQGSPFSEDTGPGDDGDLPGRSVPMSVDEIDEILESTDMSTDERRRLLQAAIADLDERAGMDRIDSHADLRASLLDAVAQLDTHGDGDGGPGSFGFDPADRLDQPDEILERAEEEEADEGG